MKPRMPTQEDVEFWGQEAEIKPMLGSHVGAQDIYCIRHPDGRVRVPWVPDDRDAVKTMDLPDDTTFWTTFWGGMLPTDAVIL